MHPIRNKDIMGILDHPDAQEFLLRKCVDRIQIDLRIITDRIVEPEIMADGSGFTITCGTMIKKTVCFKALN